MSTEPSSGPTRVGPYHLLERIGEGGMAEVWKAVLVGAAGFRRDVVIKRILPHLARDAEFVALFLSEARLSARLVHPNIVQVFELGESGGQYFMAMELVLGRDLVAVLRELLATKRQPPPGFAAIVTRDVCRALAHAHALADEQGKPLGLIHRDISPSNVMVTYDGATKLLDFGVAKALHASEKRTVTGALRGKIGYMSPQQASGLEIDQRADVYSVGILLHEMLTGRRLFKGGSELATLDLVRAGDVQPPSKKGIEVPAELERICMRALAREPEQRYASAAEMARDLDPVVASLTWDQAMVAAFLGELFPARETTPSPSTEVVAPLPWRAPATGTPVAKRRTSPRLPYLVAGVAAIFAVGAYTSTRHAEVPVAPAPVALDVSSRPSGARVFDPQGVDIGTTPLTLRRAPGAPDLVVTLHADGYEPYRLLLSSHDGDRKLDATLVASPTAIAPRPKTPVAKPVVRHAQHAKPHSWTVESILPPGSHVE